MPENDKKVDEKSAADKKVESKPEPKTAPEPDPTPDPTPDPDPVEDVAPVAPVPAEEVDECEFDIRLGDIWTSPAGYGETVTVVDFKKGDPVVVGENGENRVVAAATLAGWRHDGPTHHEAGTARL